MLAIFLSFVALANSQAPGCPHMTCVMFCANGIKKDANGCDTCSCAATPGQGVATLDCSRAPGWGWCPAYSQCVNPAVNPCPGGVTSTPGAGSGGAVGVMPNPSVHTTTAPVGSHVGVSLPVDLPQQLDASQVDTHGCPSNYPWCASVASCSAPSQCGNTDVQRAVAAAGFVSTAPVHTGPVHTAPVHVSASFGATVPATSTTTVKSSTCSKKSCKSCRAHSGCYWHTTSGGQCLPYCRPDGTCLTVGQTCPAKKASS